MAHQDKGKFFTKHPEGTKVAEDLKQEVLKQAKDNSMACKAAEKIAQKMQITLSDVGVAIDMLNINIAQCQLGLFGYEPKSKRVEAASQVSPEMEAAVRQALVNDRLSCVSAWSLAEQLGVKRMDVCAACEKLKIKVKPCQLGAF